MRLALKLAFSIGLLAWLLLRSDLGQVFASFQRLSAGTIALVLAIVAVEMGVAALKWWLFVPGERLLRILKLTLIGVFYGIVLPGQVAGEAVKAYRLGAGQANAEQIAASVVVDKVNGLIGLLLLGIAGAFLSQRDFPHSLLFSFSAALAVGVAGLYAIRLPLFQRSVEALNRKVGARWHAWTPIAMRVELFFAAWTRYAGRPGLMLASIGLGIVFQLLAITVTMILAPTFGIQLAFPEWLWIFAVVSMAVLLPLSVGGLGLREGAFVAVLGLMKVPSSSALALSLTIFASQLATALVGGLLETASVRERRRQTR
jgi:uncharacterized membrane protein YbhN (UPF0104 family)